MNPAGSGFGGFAFGATPSFGLPAASSAAPTASVATAAAPTFGTGSAFPTFGKILLLQTMENIYCRMSSFT